MTMTEWEDRLSPVNRIRKQAGKELSVWFNKSLALTVLWNIQQGMKDEVGRQTFHVRESVYGDLAVRWIG